MKKVEVEGAQRQTNEAAPNEGVKLRRVSHRRARLTKAAVNSALRSLRLSHSSVHGPRRCK